MELQVKEGCDCHMIMSRTSGLERKRREVLDITIDKFMERSDYKFDKPILCRITLIKNTMNRLQKEIEEEEVEEQSDSSEDSDLDISWEFKEFQEKLNSFEENIERMLQCGAQYGTTVEDNTIKNFRVDNPQNFHLGKRKFEEVEVEDVFSQFRLPEILSSFENDEVEKDVTRREPRAKRFRKDCRDDFSNTQ